MNVTLVYLKCSRTWTLDGVMSNNNLDMPSVIVPLASGQARAGAAYVGGLEWMHRQTARARPLPRCAFIRHCRPSPPAAVSSGLTPPKFQPRSGVIPRNSTKPFSYSAIQRRRYRTKRAGDPRSSGLPFLKCASAYTTKFKGKEIASTLRRAWNVGIQTCGKMGNDRCIDCTTERKVA